MGKVLLLLLLWLLLLMLLMDQTGKVLMVENCSAAVGSVDGVVGSASSGD